jgi:hypothetical protein
MSGITLQRCDGDFYYLVGLDQDSCTGQWKSLEAQGLLNPQQAWIPNLAEQMPGYRPPSDLCFPWLRISQSNFQTDRYTEYTVELVGILNGYLTSTLESFSLSTLYPPCNHGSVDPKIFEIAKWAVGKFINDGIVLSDKPDFSKVRYAGLSIECLDDFFRHGRFDGQPPNTFDGQILSRDTVVFFVPSTFNPMRSESYDQIATNYSDEDRSILEMITRGLHRQGRIINPSETIPGYTSHQCNKGSWLEIDSDSLILPKQFNFGAQDTPRYSMMGFPPTYPLDRGVADLANWLTDQAR